MVAGFEQAWAHYPSHEIPFLLRERARLEKLRSENKQPWKGLKVLTHMPLYLDTICKVHLLVLGGAQAVVSRPSFLEIQGQGQVEAILRHEGIPFVPDHAQLPDDFDVVLDCGGECAAFLTPRVGAVELTRTGALAYQKLNPQNYKVISIDDSYLKLLEDFYGTAEGFMKGFEHLTNEELRGQECMIFGYGKVGKGIGSLLAKKGARVTVVDVDPLALTHARTRGFSAVDFHDKAAVRTALRRAFLAVTATARGGVISEHFTAGDFACLKYLANMGADDEWGGAFERARILYGKLPINFSLPQPTAMKYLDPVFYAHTAAIDWLLNPDLSPGYHPTPAPWDRRILADWSHFHGEDLKEIRGLIKGPIKSCTTPPNS